MGGKKKSMANKLAKMSDEERVRYLQHRADIEEESRRKKEQLISTFMKDKVKKEDAFARLNLAKINQNWHQLLRKNKCKQLRELVLQFQEDFDRILENKNRSINFFLNQLDEAEIQYGFNYQNHLIQIDKIMKTQDEYLNEMRMQYEKDRSDLLEIHTNESGEISKKHQSNIEYLKVLCHGETLNHQKKMVKQYEYYQSKIFKALHENSLDMRHLQTSRERTSGAIWRLISASVVAYTGHVDKRRSHLAELRALDREGSAEIVRHQAIIQKKEAEIVKLKTLYHETKTNGTSELTNLQSTLEKVSKKSLNMKIYLNKQLIEDRKIFTHLVDESNSTLKHLERISDKGKQVVQLIDICKKYETQEDDIKLITLELKEKENEVEDQKELQEVEEQTQQILAKFDSARTKDRDDYQFSSDVDVSSTSEITEEIDETSLKITPAKSTSKDIDESLVKISNNFETVKDVGDIHSSSRKQIGDDNLFDTLKDLNKVWKKYNLVYIDVTVLKSEKAELLKGIEEQKMLLRQMLGTMLVAKNQTKIISTEEFVRTVIEC